MTVENGLEFDDSQFGTPDVTVDASVASVQDLMVRFDDGLKFPYFGMNWNALEECLLDLTWLNVNSVLIFHESLPAISEDDLELYVKVLASAVQNRSGEVPGLVVRFRKSDRSRVLDLLGRPRRP